MSLNPPDRNQRSLVDGLCSSSPSPPGAVGGVISLEITGPPQSSSWGYSWLLFDPPLSPNPYFSPSAGHS